MDDPLIQFPGYSLRRAANAAGSELASRLAELGLRQTDASALLLIGSNPDITASALGRQLDIQRANMVPLLKRLEADDLLERHAIDGKSQGLVLTKKGENVRDRALSVISQFESELLSRVPEEHRAHLLPALNSLWGTDNA